MTPPCFPFWPFGNQARPNNAARPLVPDAARAPGPGWGSYRFVGEHAMGGVRATRPAMERWFERLFRLFRFELRDVLVRGWPWRTRAVALVAVRAAVGNERYENEVAQTIDIRWGRIVAITTLEDTQKLAGALERLAAQGVEEAGAPPIEDRVAA